MNAVEPDRITRKEYPTYRECIYRGARVGEHGMPVYYVVVGAPLLR
jgi:hypothetical protein